MKTRRIESRFEQVMAPVFALLTMDNAQRIAAARVTPQIQRRLTVLGKKANFGTLTETERAELEEMVDALDLLAIFKAKARLMLIEAERN
jgi:hypothetical protein